MPSPDPTSQKLTGKQELAASLVAQDLLSDEKIAEEVGINRRTIMAWKQKIPAFNERVDALRAEFAEIARKEAIYTVEGRIKQAADRHRRLQQLIDARAAEGGKAPGADTGLLVKNYKSIGSGEYATAYEEWTTDVGMLREMREIEKQAAQDLGQWEQTVAVSGGIAIEITGVDTERI